MENVEDVNGNIVHPVTEMNFEYLILGEPESMDIVINEFLAAPLAGGDLPDVEPM